MREEIKDFEKHQVEKGEIYEMHFSTKGIFSFAKKALIEQRLRSMKEIELLKLVQTQEEAIATIKIVENPLPLAFILGGIVAVFASSMIFLSLGKIYKIANTPLGVGLGWAVPVIAGAFLISVLRREGVLN